MKILVGNIEYTIDKEYKDGFDFDLFKEKWTEDFSDYDYIVGDFSYGKLRLKGFYNPSNNRVKEYNNYKDLDKYLNNDCSYECKYFVLSKKSS